LPSPVVALQTEGRRAFFNTARATAMQDPKG
jgi:hypothetical protein